MVEEDGVEGRREVILEVGHPYWTKDGEAACPVRRPGLDEKTREIYGIDPFQALQLALAFLEIVSTSGETLRFFWPDGEPYESTASPAQPGSST